MIYSFIFNADISSIYGFLFNDKIIKAIKKIEVTDYITVLIGDFLILQLTSRLKSVQSSSNSSEKFNSYSYTRTVDTDIFNASVIDLKKSIPLRWNTIDLDLFVKIIYRNNLYLITLENINETSAIIIDEYLKETEGYIGALHVDFNDEIQYFLFINNLINPCIFQNKKLIVNKDSEYDFFDKSKFREIVYLDSKEYSKLLYNVDLPEKMNKSLTGKIINKKTQFMDIAISELSNSDQLKNFSVLNISIFPESSKLNVDLKKLTEYALNENHPKGKDKAKLFKDLLSINKNDYLYLLAQIFLNFKFNNINDFVYEKIRIGDFGIQYQVDIPILGKNGKIKNIRTGWIIKDNSPATLTTLYIPENAKEGNIHPTILKISSNFNLAGKKKFNELFNLCKEIGEEYFNKTSPNPLLTTLSNNLDKIYLEEDGICGSAYINIKKDNTGFVKWLESNGIGNKVNRTTWLISPHLTSQSYEKKYAYCFGFSMTLYSNNVNCEIEGFIS